MEPDKTDRAHRGRDPAVGRDRFQPDTVVRWHCAGFRLFWRCRSRARRQAESDVSAEVKQLIRRMATANKTWGAPVATCA